MALPLTLEELSGAWVGEVLATRNLGVVVTRLDVGRVIRGSATKVWLHLEYNDCCRDLELPPTMVLKIGFDPVMRELAFMAYEREALFFAGVSPILDVPLPQCWFAAADPGAKQAAVLLEDLCARGCRFGNMSEPLFVEAVADGLDLLARLHARYWNRTGAPELQGFDQNDGRFLVCEYLLSAPNWERCFALPRAAAIPAPIRDRERVARALRNLRVFDRRGPQCLIHGDAHLGNLYFEPDGALRLLDWQAAMTGAWHQDVAYFITCALTTEDRRASEQFLLKLYLERLRAHGVRGASSFDEAWEAYRKQVAYGILGLLCTPQMQSEEFATIMGTRFALAMEDLGTLELLG